MRGFLYSLTQSLCCMFAAMLSGAPTIWQILSVVLFVTIANLLGYVQGLGNGVKIGRGEHK